MMVQILGKSLLSLSYFLVFFLAMVGLGERALANDEPAVLSEPAIAFAARVVGDDQRARLIVDFDRNITHDSYLLDGPRRLIIDLPETLFSLDSEAETLPTSLLSQIRYGTVAAGRSRVVLDLEEPVKIASSRINAVEGGDRFRLIVDMVRTDDAGYAKSVRRSVNADAVIAKSAKPRRFKIVIDPGHGGIDGGAIGRGRTKEKDITLDFSLKLRDALRGEKSLEVVLTRETDKFMRLRDRLDMARLHNVDLFISVHADSLRQSYIRGATVYTLSEEGSDDLARVLAQKQNRADLIAGLELPKERPNVADILIDLTRRETEVFSIRFARILVKSLQNEVELIGNPHRSADFFVLKAPEVPSVLLELGYLSNSQDEELLASPEWQGKAVERTKKAIMDFFAPRLALQ